MKAYGTILAVEDGGITASDGAIYATVVEGSPINATSNPTVCNVGYKHGVRFADFSAF